MRDFFPSCNLSNHCPNKVQRVLLPPCGHLFFFDQRPNPQIYLIKTNLIVNAQIRQIFPDVEMSGSLTSPNKVSSFSGNLVLLVLCFYKL